MCLFSPALDLFQSLTHNLPERQFLGSRSGRLLLHCPESFRISVGVLDDVPGTHVFPKKPEVAMQWILLWRLLKEHSPGDAPASAQHSLCRNSGLQGADRCVSLETTASAPTGHGGRGQLVRPRDAALRSGAASSLRRAHAPGLRCDCS